MNSFGVNSAAVNGGASYIIAGAAMMLATAVASATPTVTKFPTATAALSSAVSATAVRSALGAGSCTISATFSAQWVLLSLANATATSKWTTKATPTEAWANSAFAGVATGTTIRPGAGVAAATYQASANALLTAGFAATMNSIGSMSADPSVQRSGQTTWQRDGYAVMQSSSSVIANALRTALPNAAVITNVDISATGTKVHAGAAVCKAALDISALPATDIAISWATFTASADPQLTAAGTGELTAVLSTTATCTNTTPAAGEVLNTELNVIASGRLALLGDGTSTAICRGSANARLAILGQAVTANSAAAISAKPLVYRNPEPAIALGLWTASAKWSVKRFGNAKAVIVSTITATPSTNADALDPPERTMWRPQADRTMWRPYIDREMIRTP